MTKRLEIVAGPLAMGWLGLHGCLGLQEVDPQVGPQAPSGRQVAGHGGDLAEQESPRPRPGPGLPAQLAERCAQLLATAGAHGPAIDPQSVREAVDCYACWVATPQTFQHALLAQELGDAFALEVDVYQRLSGAHHGKQDFAMFTVAEGRPQPSGRRAAVLYDGSAHFDTLLVDSRDEAGKPIEHRRVPTTGNGDCLFLALAQAALALEHYPPSRAAGPWGPTHPLWAELQARGVLGDEDLERGATRAQAELRLGSYLRGRLLAHWGDRLHQQDLASCQAMARQVIHLASVEGTARFLDVDPDDRRPDPADPNRSVIPSFGNANGRYDAPHRAKSIQVLLSDLGQLDDIAQLVRPGAPEMYEDVVARIEAYRHAVAAHGGS